MTRNAITSKSDDKISFFFSFCSPDCIMFCWFKTSKFDFCFPSPGIRAPKTGRSRKEKEDRDWVAGERRRAREGCRRRHIVDIWWWRDWGSRLLILVKENRIKRIQILYSISSQLSCSAWVFVIDSTTKENLFWGSSIESISAAQSEMDGWDELIALVQIPRLMGENTRSKQSLTLVFTVRVVLIKICLDYIFHYLGVYKGSY